MSIPVFVLDEIRDRYKSIGHHFSIPDERKLDRALDMQLASITRLNIETDPVDRSTTEAHRKLEERATKLLMIEFRKFEQIAWEVYQENLYIPSAEEDEELTEAIMVMVLELSSKLTSAISDATKYEPNDQFWRPFPLSKTHDQIKQEAATYAVMRGELLRLENVEVKPSAYGRSGSQRVQIENFFRQHFSLLHHPFDSQKNRKPLDPNLLEQSARLVTYIVFNDEEEPRLRGFEQKFVATFTRYLFGSRLSAGSVAAVAEQLCNLLEPFLKKYTLTFCRQQMLPSSGEPLWHGHLDQLFQGLNICNAEWKKSDEDYWKGQAIEDAILRDAYRGRNIGSHEAHMMTLYEAEKLAHSALGAILIACLRFVESNPETHPVVVGQSVADQMRNVFPLIEEIDPEYYLSSRRPQNKLPNRFDKLYEVSNRAKAIWPNCSSRLQELMYDEYLTLRQERAEVDRESYLQSYLDDLASDYHGT